MSGDEFAFIFYDRDAKWVKNVAEEVLNFAIKYSEEIGHKISFSQEYPLLQGERRL